MVYPENLTTAKWIMFVTIFTCEPHHEKNLHIPSAYLKGRNWLANTVKFLNFGTPENFATIYLKFKQKSQIKGYFVKKYANEIANSVDSDQTAPLGAV